MHTHHVDIESRSLADLTTVGGWHYARHPSTEILCIAIRRNKEPVLVWSPIEGFSDPGAEQLLNEMLHDDGPVYAHNATGFEVPVTEHVLTRMGFPPIKRTRWRCTATMARRANIPPSLEKAAEVLRLTNQKDKGGAALIRLFSLPRKTDGAFNDPRDHPEQFRAFCEYCRQDVMTECDIADALSHFELKGWLLDIFHEDININGRGMPVNLDALRKAQALIESEKGPAFEEFRQLTGLNPTQNKALRAWFSANGLELDNLQSDTLVSVDVDRNSNAGRAIELLMKLGFAAVKKVDTMLECAGPDDCFIRGSLQFYGAQATGRVAGRLHQPQNFKTPEAWAEEMTEDIYRHICEGWTKPMLEAWYDRGPIELIAQCIRHFIHDPQGPMLSADYSAIEARVLAWLAGEEWRLEVFRTHGQIYEAGAAQMFGLTMDEFWEHKKRTGKHHPMRKKGKVAELACIAEGEMVDVRLRGYSDWSSVPIERVSSDHLVWDGANFVAHGGVVWQGYKPVWHWNGLTATEDHVVFTTDGEMTFGRAMMLRSPLIRGLGGFQESSEGPEYIGYRPVYDILNCGPLNRFTVSGVLVHNCGYQGGVGALEKMGAIDMGLTKEELPALVRAWRAANPAIKRFWSLCENAAKDAIETPGMWHEARLIKIGVFAAAGARYLFIRLPSGRCLAYRDPKMEWVRIPKKKDETPEEEAERLAQVSDDGRAGYRLQITHFGPGATAGGARSAVWGRASLYGGKIVENITQAVAFDIMANGTLVAARKGYRIYSLIHDEAMAAWDDRERQSIEDFQRCLEDAPPWAAGLPLGTSGEVVPFYKK